MHPLLFRIGSFEVTSFGAMLAVAVLAALLLLRHELRRRGLDESGGTDAAMIGVLGGILGAKLLYTGEHWREGLASALLNRGGLSWFGGLAGGLLAGWLYLRWRRLSVVGVLSAAAPALALGHGIGRIGCFLVGDDYGRPTSLPWGVAFPQGLPPTLQPVHPTQLYELGILLILAMLLVRWRRHGMADRTVIALYLLLAGTERFFLELIRINVRVALGMTVAQWASLAAIALGIGLLVAVRPDPVQAASPVPAPSARR